MSGENQSLKASNCSRAGKLSLEKRLREMRCPTAAPASLKSAFNVGLSSPFIVRACSGDSLGYDLPSYTVRGRKSCG
jgi:hypothetical protein